MPKGGRSAGEETSWATMVDIEEMKREMAHMQKQIEGNSTSVQIQIGKFQEQFQENSTKLDVVKMLKTILDKNEVREPSSNLAVLEVEEDQASNG